MRVIPWLVNRGRCWLLRRESFVHGVMQHDKTQKTSEGEARRSYRGCIHPSSPATLDIECHCGSLVRQQKNSRALYPALQGQGITLLGRYSEQKRTTTYLRGRDARSRQVLQGRGSWTVGGYDPWPNATTIGGKVPVSRNHQAHSPRSWFVKGQPTQSPGIY